MYYSSLDGQLKLAEHFKVIHKRKAPAFLQLEMDMAKALLAWAITSNSLQAAPWVMEKAEGHRQQLQSRFIESKWGTVQSWTLVEEEEMVQGWAHEDHQAIKWPDWLAAYRNFLLSKLIWKAEQQTKKPVIHWLSPQISATVRTRTCWNQQPRILPSLSCG